MKQGCLVFQSQGTNEQMVALSGRLQGESQGVDFGGAFWVEDGNCGDGLEVHRPGRGGRWEFFGFFKNWH